MNKAFVMGVSALALMVSMPAMAETVKTETGAAVKVEGPNTYTKADDKRAAGDATKAGEAIEEAADDVADAVSEGYRDMRDYFQGEANGRDVKNIQVSANQTATGMIGQPVKDAAGKKLGKVHDIIIDRDGEARMVVVSEGGFMGLGNKLAAFDYGVIIKRDENGDVISSLTKEAIDNVAEFSYDPKKAGDKVRVIPSGGVSVAKVLDGELLGPDNKAVATVDNVAFRGGQADLLIVTFNKVLGMGGQKAVMNYDEMALVEKDKEVDFRLTAQQAARFENAKESAASN